MVPLRDDHQKSTPKAFGADFWCVIGDSLNRYNGWRLCLRLTLLTFHVSTVKERQYPGIYIQEVSSDSRFSYSDSRVGFQLKASFCFEIIWSLLLTGTGVSDPGYSVTEKEMIKPNGLLVSLS